MDIKYDIYDLAYEMAWSSIWGQSRDIIKKEINLSIYYNVSRSVVSNVVNTSQHMKDMIRATAKDYEY
jgi:hypothetical protein